MESGLKDKIKKLEHFACGILYRTLKMKRETALNL